MRIPGGKSRWSIVGYAMILLGVMSILVAFYRFFWLLMPTGLILTCFVGPLVVAMGSLAAERQQKNEARKTVQKIEATTAKPETAATSDKHEAEAENIQEVVPNTSKDQQSISINIYPEKP